MEESTFFQCMALLNAGHGTPYCGWYLRARHSFINASYQISMISIKNILYLVVWALTLFGNSLK